MNISPLKTKQSGAVLIISLIMLILLTLIAVTGMQSTGLEEKMAGNTKDHNVAFQAAETALRGAENYLDGLVTLADFADGTAGYLDEATNDPDYQSSSSWSTANSAQYISGLSGIKSEPRYIIKFVSVQNDDPNATLNTSNYGSTAGTSVTIFRVTSRGTGGADSSQVILQTYYGKRF